MRDECIRRCLAEVRWRFGGRDYPHLDCYGLVRHYLLSVHGLSDLPLVPLADRRTSCADSWAANVGDFLLKGWSPTDKLRDGVIVGFHQSDWVTHVGVGVSDTEILHVRYVAGLTTSPEVSGVRRFAREELKFYAHP